MFYSRKLHVPCRIQIGPCCNIDITQLFFTKQVSRTTRDLLCFHFVNMEWAFVYVCLTTCRCSLSRRCFAAHDLPVVMHFNSDTCNSRAFVYDQFVVSVNGCVGFESVLCGKSWTSTAPWRNLRSLQRRKASSLTSCTSPFSGFMKPRPPEHAGMETSTAKHYTCTGPDTGTPATGSSSRTWLQVCAQICEAPYP